MLVIVLAVGVGVIVLVGWRHPDSGAEIAQRRSRDPHVRRAEAEVDDLAQMLEANNARRRARGQSEITEQTMRAEVDAQEREAKRLRDDERRRQGEATEDEVDLDELLHATNASRRRRGAPELTLEQLRAEMGE